MKTSGLWVVCLGLCACGGGGGGKTLTLGTLYSSTGSLANIGTEQLEAATLAVEQINAAGGLLGFQLALRSEDDRTTETGAAEGAQKLVEEGVPVVFGATGSALSLIAFDAFKGKGIVQVSASSTSPALSSVQDDGFLNRTCPSDASQGKLLAARAKLAHTSVGIVHLPGAYGTGLAGAFTTSFTGAGGTIPMTKEYVENQQSYTTVLNQVMSSLPKPTAILLVAYPIDAAQIIKDFRTNFPSETTAFYFTDATEDAAFISAAGATTFTQFTHEGTGPSTPDGARYDEFKSAFNKRFGRDPSNGGFSANAYDSVFLVALAMEAAQSTEGAAIKNKLTAVSAGGTAYDAAHWTEAVAAAKAGNDVNFEGASGAVDLDSFGDSPAPYDIWDVVAGQIHIKQKSVSP
jgi:ABC-type branched-subunit amino acid transport system substrate-binding protein